ncbi:hypothetical protein [Metabacillus fastidiosus]|uniref:hypothetical protein n=1 Tax=Metabacillus fastidiosus TaxID=1458 RepID=UPI003D2B5FD0
MQFSIILIILIGIIALVSTILIGGLGDSNYGKRTKGNLSRLTLIYLVVILVSFGGLALYLIF